MSEAIGLVLLFVAASVAGLVLYGLLFAWFDGRRARRQLADVCRKLRERGRED